MAHVTVTRAETADLMEVAAVLAEAFHDDPVLQAVRPGADDRREALTELFSATLSAGAFATGVVDVARLDEDSEIVGVAAWEGPGGAHGGLLRQARQLPRFVRALGWAGLGRAAAVQGTLERHRPRFPHWYLAEIGVRAVARGQGVGHALLTARLARLDAQEQTAYLESSTPDNRRLYRRLGFRELEQIPGIPHAHPARMVRSPRVALVH